MLGSESWGMGLGRGAPLPRVLNLAYLLHHADGCQATETSTHKCARSKTCTVEKDPAPGVILGRADLKPAELV